MVKVTRYKLSNFEKIQSDFNRVLQKCKIEIQKSITNILLAMYWSIQKCKYHANWIEP